MRVLRKMRNIASNVNDKKLLILGVQTKCPMRTKGGYKRVAFLCICKCVSLPKVPFYPYLGKVQLIIFSQSPLSRFIISKIVMILLECVLPERFKQGHMQIVSFRLQIKWWLR